MQDLRMSSFRGRAFKSDIVKGSPGQALSKTVISGKTEELQVEVNSFDSPGKGHPKVRITRRLQLIGLLQESS